MLVFLKVKIKSLAEEARIIRLEERGVKRSANWHGRLERGNRVNTLSEARLGFLNTHRNLHEHRVVDVRREARAALLAYGFLRHRPLRNIEPKMRTKPQWGRVIQLVVKYSDKRGFGWNQIKPDFQNWINQANLSDTVCPRLT